MCSKTVIIQFISVYMYLCMANGLVETVPNEVSAIVACDTTKGPLKIEVYLTWAPIGAQHFLDLVRDGFFTDIALFRCVEGFLVQFGISDNPDMKHWHAKTLVDDPILHQGIPKHYMSYAGSGANSRSTEMFITFEDLDYLGAPESPWEVPFGRVIQGEQTLSSLYKGYGDVAPDGPGPDQNEIYEKGNAYIRENFPLIDFIKTCEIVTEKESPEHASQSESKEMTGLQSGRDESDNKAIKQDLIPDSVRKQQLSDAEEEAGLETETEETDNEEVVATKGLDVGQRDADISDFLDVITSEGEEGNPQLGMLDANGGGIEQPEASPESNSNKDDSSKSMKVAFTAVFILLAVLSLVFVLTKHKDVTLPNKSV